MSEKLRAAIERAFIDLHYAAAELKMGAQGADATSAAVEHVRLAIRELESGLRTRAPDGSQPSPEKISD
ncbi:hypothetical protein GGD83_002192 [Rhodoblastus sphagnicola]|nr:hypothetical protein [Rhodoblastus sphagnicola]MBB4198392.1 hypothetical protein [Rhodoblastus sphagnicola]